ncbi:MAG: glycoside hydrolase family 127 protein, partial [Abditibacteriota bacterium]|nr:glycoside hydrolase family 127 protein [Abditibacteriota bacterium]
WHPPTTRKECFDCSCCPPNIVRFIPSFADYMYTFDEDTLYVHQFAESEMNFEGMSVTMTTNYPADGTVKISCNTGGKRLAVRVPGWCRKFDINADYELKNGYAYIDNPSEVVVSFDMPVEVIKANRRVHDCAGRVAITRGPVVYCAEGVDNGPDVKNIRVDINGSFETAPSEFLLPALKTTGYRDPASDELYMTADGKYEEVPLTLIPYFGFANRGETDMNVWLLTK